MRSFRRSQTTPSSPRPAWQRDVRLLAVSRGISMAGAEAGYIALLALAWELTGSASKASLVLLASVLARTIGAPLAGWIGDHCNRRRVIFWSELAVAATLVAMAFAQSIPQMLVLCFLTTLAAATCGSALDASIGTLVPRADLARASSTMGMARTAGHMLGPVLGGLAVASFGARSAFLLDAGSSVIAAIVVLAIRGHVGGGRSEHGLTEGGSSDRSMLAGLRVLGGDPTLRLVLAGSAGFCVCFAFVTAAELPLAVAFGVDEPGLGAIVSSWCAGSLLGAWMARRVRVAERGPRVLVGNALACGVVFAATGVVPEFWCVLVLMAIGGFSMSLAEVVQTTLLQQSIEDHVRARVFAAYGGLLSALFGTNLAVAGLMVDATSPGTTYVFAGAWCLVAAAGFTALTAHVRRERRLATLRSIRPRHALESDLVRSA